MESPHRKRTIPLAFFLDKKELCVNVVLMLYSPRIGLERIQLGSLQPYMLEKVDYVTYSF